MVRNLYQLTNSDSHLRVIAYLGLAHCRKHRLFVVVVIVTVAAAAVAVVVTVSVVAAVIVFALVAAA